jgi:hypothetical protein
MQNGSVCIMKILAYYYTFTMLLITCVDGRAEVQGDSSLSLSDSIALWALAAQFLNPIHSR